MLEPLASMYKDLGSVASVTEGWHNHNCTIAALGRLIQKAHHEFVASLGLYSEIQGSLG